VSLTRAACFCCRGCSHRPRQAWRKYINDENSHLVSPDALALLSELLQYDHQARPTAAEAMQHTYFAPIRQMHEQQQTASKK
jgi:casein kinase II subunit alpha